MAEYSDWTAYTGAIPEIVLADTAPTTLYALQVWETIPDDETVEEIITPPVAPQDLVDPEEPALNVVGTLGAELVPVVHSGELISELRDSYIVNLSDMTELIMDNDFVTGDSRTRHIQLTVNGEPFAITEGAIVTAQIVNKTKTLALTTEPVVLLDSQPGANWATSLVAVKFPRISTVGIRIPSGKLLDAFLEAQVTLDPSDDAEDLTFYTPITLAKGNLP